MSKEHEIRVSTAVYEKIGAYVETLNKKEGHSKSWETRILEWLRTQNTTPYEKLYHHITACGYLIECEGEKEIILGNYTYKLLVLYAAKNGIRSLNNALSLLVEETKMYFLEHENHALEIYIRIIDENLKLITEGQ
jgi:hypothetical protein